MYILVLILINDLPLQPYLETTIFANDVTSSASGKTKEVETQLERKTGSVEILSKINGSKCR